MALTDRIRRQLLDGATFISKDAPSSAPGHMFVDNDLQLRFGVGTDIGNVPNVVNPQMGDIPSYNSDTKTWAALPAANAKVNTGSFLSSEWTGGNEYDYIILYHTLDAQNVSVAVFDTASGVPVETHVEVQIWSNTTIRLSVASGSAFSGSYIMSVISSPGVVPSFGGTSSGFAPVSSVNGMVGDVVLRTSDVGENTNLYYTQSRFNAAFAAKSTSDLAEGTNLYYTQTRFDDAFAAKTPADLGAVSAAILAMPSGVATLDSEGKVPVEQLPQSILGSLIYQGVWNAATNSPAIANGTGIKGHYYKVSTPGNTTIDGVANWTAGDLIVFDGTTWDQVQGGSSDVVSVAGRVGVVTLAVADVSGAASSVSLQSETSSRVAAFAAEVLLRDAAIAAEASARDAADVVLQNGISAEQSSRISALNSEATLRAGADQSLTNALNVEVTARENAIISLQSELDVETSARASSYSQLLDSVAGEATLRAGAITVEASARVAGDATNAAAIVAEASTSAAAVSTLTANLAAEVSTSAAAVLSEASARAAADTLLSASVTTETSLRTAADTTLQNNITAEASTRGAAILALGNSLSSETSDRQAAVSSEASARAAAVTGVRDSLALEVSARTAADALKAPIASPTFTGTATGAFVGSLVPSATGQDIGSATNRYHAIYVDEAHLSTATLYLGDTPVLGTTSATVNISADANQDITITTTGTGQSKLISVNGVELSVSGMNADVKFQATGAGGRAVLGATSSIQMTSPVTNIVGTLDVSGASTFHSDVTFTGTSTTVSINTNALTVKDNIITINNGELGAGVTAGAAGLRIARGSAPDQQIIFDEASASWKMGALGSEIALASVAAPTFTGTVTAPAIDTVASGTLALGTVNAATVNLGTASTTQTVNIGTGSGITTINIGGAGDTVAIAGTLTSVNTTNTNVADKLLTMNKGGGAASGFATGLEIEENATVAGYIKSTGDRTGFDLKAPGTAGVVTVTPGASGGSVWHSGNLTPANYAPLASPTFSGTVSGISSAMVGLGNVDNTADASKPVSSAQQTALNLKANLASPTFTGTVSGISASMVGLGNVDNTSDANKPVSSAQQTALNLKANLASPTFTGTVSGISVGMVSGAVSGVSGTGPIVSSGGTAPAISITAATTSAAGSMSSADKAKLNSVNAQQSIAASTASTTIDFSVANNFYLTMTANTTLALSNAASCVGQSGTIIFKQDATGNRTFTKDAAMKTPLGGASIVQVGTANTVSVLSYYIADASTILVNYIGNFA